MERRPLPRPALRALALAALTGLLLLILLAPRPLAIDAGSPGDAYFFRNTFPPESGEPTLRWARAESALLLPGAYPGAGALALRLYREPAAGPGPWPLTLGAGGGAPASFEAAPGWRVYRVALPPGAAAGPIDLGGPSFSPSPGDPRQLNVAVDQLALAPLPAAGGAFVPALGRALWLAWALGLLWAALRLLGGWAGGRRADLAVAGAGVALLAWAWAGPSSLAWMLPTSLPLAAVASLGLAGLWALGRLPAGRMALAPGWAWAIGLGVAHLALLPPIGLPEQARGLAAWAVLATPGALAALALFRAEPERLERGLLALAGAVAVAALLTLALHALPGPLPSWLLLLAADGLSLLGLWALTRPASARLAAPHTPLAKSRSRWLLPGLLLAAVLRLTRLGSSDLQGDEAYALLLARGVRHGQDDILLVHMKGPIEALLPAGPLALSGAISEWTARLPFAVASLGIMLGAWALSRRLIGGRGGARAGAVAAVALAVDGILLAFGRIVQYQSVVLLMSIAALWLCWRFYRGAPAAPYLPAAALCAAVGVLAHYDGAFVAPAMAYLVIAGGLRRGWHGAGWLKGLAAPLAIGVGLTLSFYLPFVLHEHFARTLGHLSTRSGQGAAGGVALFNNLPGYAALAGFYTTRFQLAATALALLGGLAYWLIRGLRPRALGPALAGLLLVAAPLALLRPALFAVGPDRSWAGLLIAPPLLALCLAPRLRPGMRALLIWLAAPLLANGFLLADPRTHFYTLHVPATLLAALAATRLFAWLRARPARRPLAWPLAGAGAALLALALPYAGLLFLRQEPEYERAFPATRVPLYAPPPAGTLADDGYFGFPRRDGWKAAGELLRRGELRGTIGSNQELFIPGWYLRGQLMCGRDPDYFFTALGARPLYIPPGYQLYGAVSVDGVRALEIYSRAPVNGPPRSFDAADYAPAFDAAPVPNFPLRRLLSGVVPQHSVGAAWAAGFSLRGYDLDRSALGPGESAFLTLYWRAEADLPASAAPVVELRDAAGQTVATASRACTAVPADAWRKTYVNDTPLIVDSAGLPPGSYTLHVGVRDGKRWLPLVDGRDLLPLATMTVAGDD